MKGGTYVNLFFLFVQLYVYLYSVPSHLVFNPRIGFSVLCSWLMIGFFSFRPSLLDLAGGISTQLPALAKKIKEEKEKRRAAKEKKKSHGELWFLIGF